jgi:hypothetical protein
MPSFLSQMLCQYRLGMTCSRFYVEEVLPIIEVKNVNDITLQAKSVSEYVRTSSLPRNSTIVRYAGNKKFTV